ncbi:MAG: preprotein translocase subunit SecG [bacterium]|nr:preprotein translocase subunit SecG [bacterium]
MLTIIEILIAIALIILILLQERSAGLGGLLGGSEGGGVYHTRRGLERAIYYSTIGLVALFIIVAILDLIF